MTLSVRLNSVQARELEAIEHLILLSQLPGNHSKYESRSEFVLSAIRAEARKVYRNLRMNSNLLPFLDTLVKEHSWLEL